MRLSIDRELQKLQQLTIGDLQQRFASLFGDPPTSRHREWLVRRIIWRLQADAEGDLSERARRRAAELANHADLRVTAPSGQSTRTLSTRRRTPKVSARDERLPSPGAQITRRYKGQTIPVTVREDGFEFQGETFATLTAIAKRVTGSHWNGFHFFGLSREQNA